MAYNTQSSVAESAIMFLDEACFVFTDYSNQFPELQVSLRQQVSAGIRKVLRALLSQQVVSLDALAFMVYRQAYIDVTGGEDGFPYAGYQIALNSGDPAVQIQAMINEVLQAPDRFVALAQVVARLAQPYTHRVPAMLSTAPSVVPEDGGYNIDMVPYNGQASPMPVFGAQWRVTAPPTIAQAGYGASGGYAAPAMTTAYPGWQSHNTGAIQQTVQAHSGMLGSVMAAHTQLYPTNAGQFAAQMQPQQLAGPMGNPMPGYQGVASQVPLPSTPTPQTFAAFVEQPAQRTPARGDRKKQAQRQSGGAQSRSGAVDQQSQQTVWVLSGQIVPAEQSGELVPAQQLQNHAAAETSDGPARGDAAPGEQYPALPPAERPAMGGGPRVTSLPAIAALSKDQTYEDRLAAIFPPAPIYNTTESTIIMAKEMNKQPLEGFLQEFFTARIKDDMQPIYKRQHRVAFVNGPSHTSKATRLSLAISHQSLDNVVVCVHHSRYTVNRAVNHAKTLLAEKRQVEAYATGSDLDSAHLVFASYSDIVAEPNETLGLLRRATHVVLAHVHAQTIDQELASLVIYKAQLSATIVLVTSYLDSGVFDGDCYFRRDGFRVMHCGPMMDPYKFCLALKQERQFPKVSYLEPSGLSQIEVDKFAEWAFYKAVELFNKSIVRQDGYRLLIFAPSNAAMWELNAQFRISPIVREVKLAVVVLDPRDHRVRERINKAPTERGIVLMRPYFGERVHLTKIDAVLCPAVTEQPVLDQRSGKAVPKTVELSSPEIRFLAEHTSRQVYYAFSSDVHDRAPAVWDPPFFSGDLLEYTLKACSIAPGQSLSAGVINGAGLRLTAGTSLLSWVITQLQRLGLIAHEGYGFRPTDRGRDVIAWSRATGLGLTACLSMAIYMERVREPPGDDESPADSALLDVFMSVVVVEELELPMLGIKYNMSNVSLKQSLDVLRCRLANPRDEDGLGPIEALEFNDHSLHVVAVAVMEKWLPPWPVQQFDLVELVRDMRARAVPDAGSQAVLTKATVAEAQSRKSFEAMKQVWWQARMHNLAFVCGTEKNRPYEEPLEAFDLCSTRWIRIDPQSMVDVRYYLDEVGIRRPNGMYFTYSKLSRKCIDGTKFYEASGIQFVEAEDVAKFVVSQGYPFGIELHKVVYNTLFGIPPALLPVEDNPDSPAVSSDADERVLPVWEHEDVAPTPQVPLIDRPMKKLLKALKKGSIADVAFEVYKQAEKRRDDSKQRVVQISEEKAMKKLLEKGAGGLYADLLHTMSKNMIKAVILGTVYYQSLEERQASEKLEFYPLGGPGAYSVSVCVEDRADWLNKAELSRVIDIMKRYYTACKRQAHLIKPRDHLSAADQELVDLVDKIEGFCIRRPRRFQLIKRKNKVPQYVGCTSDDVESRAKSHDPDRSEFTGTNFGLCQGIWYCPASALSVLTLFHSVLQSS
ncbi:hypothetical protein VTJ49DRAFT_4618 [Mycothermus thermophilus]|uniref:Uncharacterized protein n=1 Tax=Humicola insolens TaxID=85995 RepID=A0ABR3V4X5_HUMIN